jgi:hypothetical protein
VKFLDCSDCLCAGRCVARGWEGVAAVARRGASICCISTRAMVAHLRGISPHATGGETRRGSGVQSVRYYETYYSGLNLNAQQCLQLT